MNSGTAAKTARLLVVDYDEEDRRIAVSRLADEKYEVAEADSFGAALELIEKQPFDLVIAADRIADQPALKLLEKSRQGLPDTSPVLLILSESGGEVPESLPAQACDCLVRPVSSTRLISAVRRALEEGKMLRELTHLRQAVAMSYGFDNIVGITKPMLQLRETASRLAPTDITVLISGAPGTGKELLARTLHHHSKRRHGPFVAIDFSAIPKELITSELDPRGNKAALRWDGDYVSLIESADGGTLFLDEVSCIPALLQPRLARFLRTLEIGSRGSLKARKVDLRVIAASNQDLEALVRERKYDKDLWAILSVIPVEIPPLAERMEDVEILAEYFLRRIAAETNRAGLSISRQAVEKLLGHVWPGNVRELENSLRRAAALCRNNQVEAEDITFIAGDSRGLELARTSMTIRGRKNGLLDDSQRSLIARALDDNNWNFTQTAQELGIGRTTLWRKVKKYQLKKEPVAVR
ncbi:MAG: sigma-54-dependent Fis family transcriptional regulator [candidate division Zixibacteria bacterium]|nr:sigma-54-dependent Fis family transcriptional regulator [candidate division Zixibacteria bacterium]